jgi:hypothetical protein
MKVMWNGRTYAAMAIAGAGLAVAAAATPASAWWPGSYGSVGCGSYYGAAYGPGSLGCGDYGYAGTFTYGWPYANNVIPISGYGSYGYAPAYGYGYGNSPAYGFGYGYAPAYGYGYSYAPAYGYGGWGCGRAHRARDYGYATAYRRPYNFAVASYRGHRPTAFAYAPARSLRVAVGTHHDGATKLVHSHIASRNNVKLARAD